MASPANATTGMSCAMTGGAVASPMAARLPRRLATASDRRLDAGLQLHENIRDSQRSSIATRMR